MQAEKLLHNDKESFITFCLKHRDKLDESFLYDKELEHFSPDDDNPTYIVKKDGNIIAAASLILDDYNRRGRNGRFRIFYSEDVNGNLYSILLMEVMKHLKEIDKIFLFVPRTNNELSDNIKSLHFVVDRYIYFLVKEITGPQSINLPDGYSIRTFQTDKDEDDWCYVRNVAFSNLNFTSTLLL